MKEVAKSFGMFLVFTLVAQLVVKPVAVQANIPVLKDL